MSLDERVPVIVAGLGSPGPVTDEAHRLGIKVMADEEGTVVSRASSGKPCRLIRNNFTRSWEGREAEIQPFPVQFERVGKPSAIRAREQADIENGSAACGQSAGLIRDVRSAGAALETVVSEPRPYSAASASSKGSAKGGRARVLAEPGHDLGGQQLHGTAPQLGLIPVVSGHEQGTEVPYLVAQRHELIEHAPPAPAMIIHQGAGVPVGCRV